MKRLITFSTLLASPALAHSGHAELPGAGGHDAAHVLMAVVAVGLVCVVSRAINQWIDTRKED